MQERRSFLRDEIESTSVDDAATRVEGDHVACRRDAVVDCLDLVGGSSGTELYLVGQLRSLIDRFEWHARAACRGRSDVNFFPARGESIRVARALCSGCVVGAECLDYALAHDGTVGVWGGMTKRERERVRRERLAS
jgi:WhiB family transcriptional regulator, redox-sensing transcriptional regulator